MTWKILSNVKREKQDNELYVIMLYNPNYVNK